MPPSPLENGDPTKTRTLNGVTAAVVVLTVLAAGWYFLAPLASNHRTKALGTDTLAKNRAIQIQIAVANFYTDYNAFPILSPYADHVGIADAELVHALDGSNPVINPRQTAYLYPRPDSLSPDDALIDPWGTPYHVHIDTTFNRRIANPEPDTARPEIPDTVLVYSAGPDRDPATWHDNITTWD